MVVLVLEGEPAVAGLLAYLVREEGHEPRVALSLEEADGLLSEEPGAVFVSFDLGTRAMTGLDWLEAHPRFGPRSVVATAGAFSDAVVERIRRCGATPIWKTFPLATLRALLFVSPLDSTTRDVSAIGA